MRGGRGVGLNDRSATTTKLQRRGPLHRASLRVVPLPVFAGRTKLSRSRSAFLRPSRQISRFKISAPNDRGALFSSSLRHRKQRKAERRQTLCNNLRTGRCGARPVSLPSPICGREFRGGTLACRRPTAALAKGTYVTPGATQAMLPGTWSDRVLPAFACPSPVSTSRADRSIGRLMPEPAGERAVSSRPRPPHPLRIPEYLRERRP